MAALSGRRSRRTTVLAVAATAALIAGAMLVRLSGQPSSDSSGASRSPNPSSRTKTQTGATSSVSKPASAQVGFASGKRGAVAAAVAYATASQRWLYLSDDELHAAIAKIAAPAGVSRLTADVVTNISMARDQLRQSSGRVWWLVRPLAWRIDDFRADEARVSVWTVTVLSAAGVAAPQSEYVTVTLDLARVEGEWRVAGVRDAPGPTPITGPHDQPWDAEPFDHALDGFTRMGEEPNP